MTTFHPSFTVRWCVLFIVIQLEGPIAIWSWLLPSQRNMLLWDTITSHLSLQKNMHTKTLTFILLNITLSQHGIMCLSFYHLHSSLSLVVVIGLPSIGRITTYWRSQTIGICCNEIVFEIVDFFEKFIAQSLKILKLPYGSLRVIGRYH